MQRQSTNMGSVHELVIELLWLKISPDLIEDHNNYANVPVLAVLESAQDRNDVMDQLQWRATGKVAAKFIKMRNSNTAEIQNKSTWELVFDNIKTVQAETFAKAKD